jgi:hypothetical protein
MGHLLLTDLEKRSGQYNQQVYPLFDIARAVASR